MGRVVDSHVIFCEDGEEKALLIVYEDGRVVVKCPSYKSCRRHRLCPYEVLVG